MGIAIFNKKGNLDTGSPLREVFKGSANPENKVIKEKTPK